MGLLSYIGEMMKLVLTLIVVTTVAAGDDFEDGVNFRILKKNFLNKGLSGGIRFGVGYGVSYNSLDPDQVSFKKYQDGKYTDIERSDLGKIELRAYEEAFCDSDVEENDPENGEVEEDCFPAIKGFISIESASCELAGRYIINYKDTSKRFNIVIRQCGSRYDWFEDGYWSDADSDREFEDYYNEDDTDTYLGVNEDNFLNKDILGGFRVRVGAEELQLENMKVYKKDSDSLPEGMSLDKKIYEKTCPEVDSDSETEDEVKKCKPAIYGFVTAAPATCSMDGEYYLEYAGEKVEFDVHVKSCGKDDWESDYDSDYLYDSDQEESFS